MKFRHSIILLSALTFGAAAIVHPQDRDRHEQRREEVRDLHQRLRRCHERIDSGVANRDLTREEHRRLQGELNAVRDDEARMRADGRLTHREVERLEMELSRLERHITALKHNDKRRRH